MYPNFARSRTFLFTDIEGSTQLWERYEALMGRVMARHDTLAEAVVREHGGELVRPRGEGDSLFIVFEQADDGARAAIALQCAFHSEPWPEETPLNVRMALHSGSAEFRANDFYGRDVNRCARLRGAARGGQIVLSRATRDLLSDGLTAPAVLRDLGLHRLKDLERAEQVFQLLHPPLPAEFPPLNSLDASRHNLPIQTKSFVGREEDVKYLARLCERTPLLTLTGPGGAGKTQLALHIAAERIERFPDGVWLVNLDSLQSGNQIPQALLAVLRTPEEPHTTQIQTLCDTLKARKTLLVLDSCEHLAPDCAAIAETLLIACPDLRILATSQIPLGWGSEYRRQVPPLSLPFSSEESPTLLAKSLPDYAATRLFIERAAAHSDRFAVNEATAPLIADICLQLDGVPLLIELAAARVGTLALGTLARELYTVIQESQRQGLDRQRSARAVIEWSCGLLSDAQTRLLRRLSIFEDSFTLEAAQAVCSDATDTPEQILNVLPQLTLRSLVQADEQADGTYRYRLLNLTRRHAAALCEAAGETEALQSRHAAHYLALAEEADTHYEGMEQGQWMAWMDSDFANCRAALQMVAGGESRLRLAAALESYWERRGHYREGRESLEWALQMAGENISYDTMQNALNGLGILAWAQQDHEQAIEYYSRALTLARQQNRSGHEAKFLTNIGLAYLSLHRCAEAREPLERSVALFTEQKDDLRLFGALNNLAMLLFMENKIAKAYDTWRKCAEAERKKGLTFHYSGFVNNMGEAARKRKKWAIAEAHHLEALEIRAGLRNALLYAEALSPLALIAFGQGEWERAAQLFGAMESACEQSGIPVNEYDLAEILNAQAKLKKRLGADAYEDALRIGRRFTTEQVLEYAKRITPT